MELLGVLFLPYTLSCNLETMGVVSFLYTFKKSEIYVFDEWLQVFTKTGYILGVRCHWYSSGSFWWTFSWHDSCVFFFFYRVNKFFWWTNFFNSLLTPLSFSFFPNYSLPCAILIPQVYCITMRNLRLFFPHLSPEELIFIPWGAILDPLWMHGIK